MANKIYVHEETAITFKNTGGTVTFTPDSITAGNGAQSAHHDLTTSARSRRFAWRAYCKMQAAPAIGDTIDVYLKYSDGTYPDNDDGTGDIALSSTDKLRNLHYIGNIVMDENSATPTFVGSGSVEIDHRYVAVVFLNSTAVQVSTTAADSGFILTPVPDEVQ
jgi:hypothetical protein